MSKTILVDQLLDLYEKTKLEEYMLLAERADEAYQLIAKYPNSRNLLKRCISMAEKKYGTGKDMTRVKYWIEKVFSTEDYYNKTNQG